MLHGHHAQEGIMKKNSLTKLLALTLCAVLALSLFAGCAAKTEETAPAASETTESTATETTEAATEEAAAEETTEQPAAEEATGLLAEIKAKVCGWGVAKDVVKFVVGAALGGIGLYAKMKGMN